MMPGYGGMGFGWMFMSLGSVLFLVLVGVGIWLLVRTTNPAQPGSARETLAQRYARGEIDEQEYQQRLRTLGG